MHKCVLCNCILYTCTVHVVTYRVIQYNACSVLCIARQDQPAGAERCVGGSGRTVRQREELADLGDPWRDAPPARTSPRRRMLCYTRRTVQK